MTSRSFSRLVRPVFMLGMLWPAQALAQQAPDGVAANGLPGVDRVGLPTTTGTGVSLAGSGSYGFTEAQDSMDGSHHRLGGRLGLGVVPHESYGFALELDGRHDMHPDDGMGSDSGSVGDLRLHARAGTDVSDALSLGGALSLWLAGEDAPSVKLAATTVDLELLLAWSAPGGGLTLATLAGFRLDNSAEVAPELNELRKGDRLALGLSDHDAVLLGLALAHRSGALELLSEISWDVAVGSGAPSATQSPLRLSAGARYHASSELQFEMLLKASLSGRPDQQDTELLVIIEPRFGTQLGIRYLFGFAPPPVVVTVSESSEVVAVEPEVPTSASVKGRIVDEDGAPMAGVVVELDIGEEPRQATTDDAGGYAFDEVPFGVAALKMEQDGYEPREWSVEVASGLSPLEDQVAMAVKVVGQLRGLTRSFGGKAVRASILVVALGNEEAPPLELKADTDGRFEVDLKSGKYRVTVTASGYRKQVREVEITEDGVTILNLDLRKGRR